MVFGDVFRQRADYTKGLFYSGRNGIFQGASPIQPEKADIIRKDVVIKGRGSNASADSVGTTLSSCNVSTTAENISAGDVHPPKVEPPAKPAQKATKAENVLIDHPREKSFKNILKFSSQPKDHSKELAEIRRRKLRKVNTIVIDHTIQEEWKLEVYGGVQMWVHIKTGEVSVERPKTAQTTLPKSPKKSSIRFASMGNYFRKHNRVAIAGNSSLEGGNSSGKYREASLRSHRGSEKTVYQNSEMKELMAMFDAGQSSRKIRAAIAPKKISPSV